MATSNLSVERLREVLSYDKETGTFRWRVTLSNRSRCDDIAGCLSPDGYRRIRIDGRLFQAHRLAWLWATGEWPSQDVDHVNMERADNRFVNLRAATRQQNMANTRVRPNNKSGYKGVCWNSSRCKWQARITVDGKGKHLGLYLNAQDAHAAYQQAAESFFGNFARVA